MVKKGSFIVSFFNTSIYVSIISLSKMMTIDILPSNKKNAPAVMLAIEAFTAKKKLRTAKTRAENLY